MAIYIFIDENKPSHSVYFKYYKMLGLSTNNFKATGKISWQ